MKALQLNTLKKEIPEEAFQKSVWKGIYYMLVDYAMWAGSIFAIYTFTKSDMWATLPYWQQTLASVIFWNVAGFLMWCIFITGHDCGHGTFADSELVNDIFGHISHGSIMVPFYSWQVGTDCQNNNSATGLLDCTVLHNCPLTPSFTQLSCHTDAITCTTITSTRTTHTHGTHLTDLTEKTREPHV